ncbi:MAG: hypothetical protein ABWW70_06030, partial [Thermoproteota archaeon]
LPWAWAEAPDITNKTGAVPCDPTPTVSASQEAHLLGTARGVGPPGLSVDGGAGIARGTV